MVNNVIRSAPAIKSDRVLFGGLLPLEQLFGGRAMLGDPLDMRFDSGDLFPERGRTVNCCDSWITRVEARQTPY